MRRLLSNKRFQIAFNGGLAVVVLTAAAVGGRRFSRGGWPLQHADPLLVAAAAVLFLVAYAFKAWGWQRLFAADERPGAGALAFAGGAACVGGVALPGRLDDALRIAVVKRFPGVRTGLASVALSLLVLGLLDNAALAPLASVAAVNADSWTVQLGFAVVARPACSRRRSSRRCRRWRRGSSRCASGSAAGSRRAGTATGGGGGAVLHLDLVVATRDGGVPPTRGALDARLVPARARIPVRVGGVGGAADRAGGRGDAGGAGAAILMASGVHSADAIASPSRRRCS